MKNALFATTALVAAGFAGSAFAAEPLTASVRGYANVGLGYVDSDDDTADGVGVLRDGEVHVRAKGSSDNGLTFEFRFELEMFGATDQVDENWAAVSGSFGQIMIGGNDDAQTSQMLGVFYGPGSIIGYYDHIGRTGALGIDGGSDDLGIHYFTPNFEGFQAAVSYQPTSSCDDRPTTSDDYYCDADDADGDNIWSIGASYSREFDGVSVGLSAGYTDADGDDMEIWAIGGELGAYGFSVGAFYEENAGADAGSDLALGVSYSTGPWTVAGGFSTLLDAPAGEDVSTFGAWATYALMKGVSTTAGIEHTNSDVDGDATAGIVYLSLSF